MDLVKMHKKTPKKCVKLLTKATLTIY